MHNRLDGGADDINFRVLIVAPRSACGPRRQILVRQITFIPPYINDVSSRIGAYFVTASVRAPRRYAERCRKGQASSSFR